MIVRPMEVADVVDVVADATKRSSLLTTLRIKCFSAATAVCGVAAVL